VRLPRYHGQPFVGGPSSTPGLDQADEYWDAGTLGVFGGTVTGQVGPAAPPSMPSVMHGSLLHQQGRCYTNKHVHHANPVAPWA
jgi:hypothetical protein